MRQLELKFPCPCCGHLVHDEQPGSFGICCVCFWEDDVCQLRWPRESSGANKVSLIQAQLNYEEFGAIEMRFKGLVRPPASNEPVDEGWRRIDPATDIFEEVDDAQALPWPEDRTVLYWWRDSFWRTVRY